MKIRLVTDSDAAEWQRLRKLLWPNPAEQHGAEIKAYFDTPIPTCAVFVIDFGHNRLGGFLEARLRDYAEGCSSDRVAYIEGWYVEPDLREQGLGGQLISAAEDWARELGLTEMASDCLIDNEVSIQAHLALDFEEVERIVCFRKRLKSP
jgi:aminoglycoside 6'-N-acetyltransferase I